MLDAGGQAPFPAAGASSHRPPSTLLPLSEPGVTYPSGQSQHYQAVHHGTWGFLGAPGLETMAWVASESPACHLASWQAAEPRRKLNPIGVLRVLRGTGARLETADRRQKGNQKLFFVSPMGFRCAWTTAAGHRTSTRRWHAKATADLWVKNCERSRPVPGNSTSHPTTGSTARRGEAVWKEASPSE